MRKRRRKVTRTCSAMTDGDIEAQMKGQMSLTFDISEHKMTW